MKKAVAIVLFALSLAAGYSQPCKGKNSSSSVPKCAKILSILVDACGNPEGANEVLLFQVGSNSINTSNLSFTWASNSFKSWCKNTGTAKTVSDINATITSCGYLKEPSSGVLPANAKVYVFTSEDFIVGSNAFTNLQDTAYAIFQCSGNTAGHFVNYSSTSGLRTTILKVSGSCNDTVTYNRNLLIKQDGTSGAEDGAYIVSDLQGNVIYKNDGCIAPVEKLKAKISVTPTTAICPTDSVKLTANLENAKCFVWRSSDGKISDTTKQKTAFHPNKTTAKLYLFAWGSCTSAVDSIVVKTKSKPTFNVGNDTAICASSLNLKAKSDSNNLAIFWNTSGNGTFSPNGNFTSKYIVGNKDTGIVKIFAKASNNCFALFDTLLLNLKGGSFAAKAGNDTFVCAGQSINLKGISGAASNKWTRIVGNGSIANDTLLNTTYTPQFNDTIAKLVLTPKSNCLAIPDTLIAYFTHLNKPSFTVSDTNPCPTGDTIKLIPNPIGGVFKGINIVNNNGFVAKTSGTFTIWYVITKNNCKDSISKKIVVKTASNKKAFAGKDTFICGLGQINLNGVGDKSPYNWSSTGTGSINNNTAQNTYYTNNNNLDTSIRFIFTSNSDCGVLRDTFVAHITKRITPTFSISDTSICEKEDSIYLYPDANKGYFSGINASITPAWFPNKAGLQTIYYIVKHGACIDSAKKMVLVNPLPNAGFSVSPTTTTVIGKLVLVLPVSTSGKHYWTYDGQTKNSISITTSKIGKFKIFHRLVDTLTGCEDTASNYLIVDDEEQLFISNIFTPNNDSINDYFYASGVNIDKFYMMIYNRWGAKLFVTERLDYGWDGRVKSALAPDGVYFYLVKAQGKSGKKYEFKGTLTLVR